MCALIPSTKELRYVSRADKRVTSVKKLTASVMLARFAMLFSISKFALLTPKPLADTHLALGALNFNPATT